MLRRLTKFILRILDGLIPGEEKVLPLHNPDYFSLLDQARLEWQLARDRFDQISDPDLIDHAIYNLGAAEQRYVFLLKKAKEEGVNLYSALDERGG